MVKNIYGHYFYEPRRVEFMFHECWLVVMLWQLIYRFFCLYS